MTATECYSCRHNATTDLPERESIYRSADWRVAHAFNSTLPGWLVVIPTSHVESIADLSDSAASELGLLQRAISIAHREVLGAMKSYVMFFAEAEGFAHLHVHVVPRMPDQPTAERGPNIFSRLSDERGAALPPHAQDSLAREIAAVLASTLYA
jgi:diadenosine tetraphosphate (Ap4A) HIT family hydrolase